MTFRKGQRPPYYRIMADCLVLLTSLVLTEPRITRYQSEQIGRLIGKLKVALSPRPTKEKS